MFSTPQNSTSSFFNLITNRALGLSLKPAGLYVRLYTPHLSCFIHFNYAGFTLERLAGLCGCFSKSRPPLFEERPIVLPSSFVLNIYIYFFLSKKYFILFYILSCWREGEKVYFQNKLFIFCLSWVGKENRRPHQRIYSHFPFKLKKIYFLFYFFHFNIFQPCFFCQQNSN